MFGARLVFAAASAVAAYILFKSSHCNRNRSSIGEIPNWTTGYDWFFC